MPRLGKGSGTRLLEQIGALELGPYRFEVYEGSGGHVQGETVFVERRQRWIFSGDIFVNIKGFTPEQAQFNKLAPYLMTSVDTDPRQARREREALFGLADPGPWRLIGGHGGFYDMMIE